MFARLTTTPLRMLTIAAFLPLAMACSGDDPVSPSQATHVGRWQVTSFLADGVELLEPGSSIEISLTAAGTWASVQRENGVVCNECSTSGNYSITSTSVTFDAGFPGEFTAQYELRHDVMTMKWRDELFGSIVLTLQRL